MTREFITPQIVLKMPRQENETVAARAAWTNNKQTNREKADDSTSDISQKCIQAHDKNADSEYKAKNVQFHF